MDCGHDHVIRVLNYDKYRPSVCKQSTHIKVCGHITIILLYKTPSSQWHDSRKQVLKFDSCHYRWFYHHLFSITRLIGLT